MREDSVDGHLSMGLEPRVPLQLVDVAIINILIAETLDEYVDEGIELTDDELTLGAMVAQIADILKRDGEVVHVPIDALEE
jgi:hypothetical protein